MRCTEHIQFRSLSLEIDEVIKRHISPLLKETEIQRQWDIRVYQHDRIPSDLLMTLTCKTGSTEPDQKELGIQIAESLKDLGAVSHTVWNQFTAP